MSGHSVLFVVAVSVVVLCSLIVGAYYLHRARRTREGSWENILKRLTYVDRSCVEDIALDIINENGQQRTDDNSFMMEAQQIWRLIGGWDGLDALEANCLVLIDLAFYLQQWYPEAFAVTQQLRLNAREIQGQISRLRIADKNGKLDSMITMFGQQAIATYYLMTQQVLDLYERLGVPMLPELQKSL